MVDWRLSYSLPKPPGMMRTSIGGAVEKSWVGTTDWEKLELNLLSAGRGPVGTGSRVDEIMDRLSWRL